MRVGGRFEHQLCLRPTITPTCRKEPYALLNSIPAKKKELLYKSGVLIIFVFHKSQFISQKLELIQ